MRDSDRHVCQGCWDSIPRLTNHPLFLDTEQKLLDSAVIDGLVSVFLFEKGGVLQDLAHALKYDGFESVGTLLGRELGSVMQARRIRADLIIPIPLHRARLRERGFNQAEAIARGVSEATGIPWRSDAVIRNRATETQTKLGIPERQKNMEGAFDICGEAVTIVQGANCLLVDDVITTGATIVSCADALKRAGSTRIVAASAALAE